MCLYTHTLFLFCGRAVAVRLLCLHSPVRERVYKSVFTEVGDRGRESGGEGKVSKQRHRKRQLWTQGWCTCVGLSRTQGGWVCKPDTASLWEACCGGGQD